MSELYVQKKEELEKSIVTVKHLKKKLDENKLDLDSEIKHLRETGKQVLKTIEDYRKEHDIIVVIEEDYIKLIPTNRKAIRKLFELWNAKKMEKWVYGTHGDASSRHPTIHSIVNSHFDIRVTTKENKNRLAENDKKAKEFMNRGN